MKLLRIVLPLALLAALAAFTMPYEKSNPEPLPTEDSVLNQQIKTGLNIGDLAPELAFENPDGKIIKLSSLRGNIVLIDFWASWCGPCRRENPNVVAAYNKYSKANFKDAKGFKIYSVSLDKNKSQWVNAIAQDNLNWDSHVSDLGYWSSEPAQIYGIRSIPYNFLLDKDGIIIAKNLRGQNLHIALDKLVKNL